MVTFSYVDSVYWILFSLAIVAGIVDAIAGGGGLITVPCLLLAGVPPLSALGTNRLQAVIGEATASLTFIMSKQIPLDGLVRGSVWTYAGALLGSVTISLVDKESLEILLPVLMAAITVYSVASKKLKAESPRIAKMNTKQFMMVCGLLIGFYNGFFGPGTGSLWMLCFVVLLGFTLKQATMVTKPLNLVGNLVSLLMFIYLGHVDFALGLIMGLGQVIGSIAGSKLVLSYGSRLVRPVFISVTTLMTAKLIFDRVFTDGLV
ncbi:hypothetical protein DBZ36_13080 [Alginatibacterium sediminis]|uniref:Probable membrane transporter protein n=1 Tax=Alginatibacterium sediminis TaxID=2164068 RepID=A0A420EA23_9ALTE|nr:hypothetical protein DBZ36_13080 [Alginatibacterium sediminis]